MGGAVILLHLCAVKACYWETFTLGSAHLLAVGFVMRAACVVVRLVVSRCYVKLDICWCVRVCVCVCVCVRARARGDGRSSAPASVPFAVGILL